MLFPVPALGPLILFGAFTVQLKVVPSTEEDNCMLVCVAEQIVSFSGLAKRFGVGLIVTL